MLRSLPKKKKKKSTKLGSQQQTKRSLSIVFNVMWRSRTHLTNPEERRGEETRAAPSKELLNVQTMEIVVLTK